MFVQGESESTVSRGSKWAYMTSLGYLRRVEWILKVMELLNYCVIITSIIDAYLKI